MRSRTKSDTPYWHRAASMSSVERKLTLTPQCLLRVCDAEDVGVTFSPGTQGFHLGTRSFQVFTEARLKGSSPQRGFSDFLSEGLSDGLL